ncbi:site-specific DNA-methyltransferase [Mycoplasmopsis felis]|uniref:DNA methyltransferase n=1 Tax=Mycoplasmopsis felis TaxID=33923 RepID=UPI0021B06332|nr:site-specific DNA-methyltransferase [Mycoplasmopsis felis]UWV85503.1 site-specific DNA-methyltransferase [Mycoplasmopsis felis]
MDHRRKVYLESILNNGSTTMGRNEIEKLFDSKIFSYPKSEILINKIIDSSIKQNDLILDFFLGSGITAAVAHKMNRRYIGIEQMDYIQDITIERLKKVIDGEQGGISKSVNWNGGVICILWIAWKYKFFNFANPRCKKWKHYNH